MKLPGYRSIVKKEFLSVEPDGSHIFNNGQFSCRLNSLEYFLATCWKGTLTAKEIISLVRENLIAKWKSISESDVLECFSTLLDKGLIKEVNNSSKSWSAPLLITGSPRSGTSILARTLSSHDKFCIYNEYALYAQDPKGLEIWNRLRDMREDNPPPLKASNNTGTMKEMMRDELPLPTSNLQMRDWLFNTIKDPIQVYGDKMPYDYLRKMNDIKKECSGVKFLVTLRDGRAVIASQIRNYYATLDSGRALEHWMKPSVQEAEYLWLRSARTWLSLRSNPPAPCLEVRYEQAVASPENLSKEICDFVGTTYRESDFREFRKEYQPVHTYSWREEIENMNGLLSDEFLEALKLLGYD